MRPGSGRRRASRRATLRPARHRATRHTHPPPYRTGDEGRGKQCLRARAPRVPDPCPATPILNAEAREGPGFLGRRMGAAMPSTPRPAHRGACRSSPAEPRRPPPPPSAPLLPAPLRRGRPWRRPRRGAGHARTPCLAPARPQLAHPTAAHTAARPPSCPACCSLLEALRVGASPSLRSCTPYRPFRGGGGRGGLPSPTAAPLPPPLAFPFVRRRHIPSTSEAGRGAPRARPRDARPLGAGDFDPTFLVHFQRW